MALLGDLEVKEGITETIDTPKEALPDDLPGDVPRPTWFYKEGVPGYGSKPEYLLDKYKTVEDQAKAYVDAQKALGAMQGAPEAYEFGDMSEYLDLENPHLKELQGWAKENKISQDAMNTFTKKFLDYASSQLPNEEEELEKIDKVKLATLQNFCKSNLSREIQEKLNKMTVTSDLIEVLSEMRHAVVDKGGSTSVTRYKSEPQRFQSSNEIMEEMTLNYDKYRSDPAYQSIIYRKLEEAKAREMGA